MSMTFTKLFSSITESTIWVEDHQTRIVWITMLAMADAHGRVWGSIPGLANRARVTVDECEAALEKFKAPDRYSRTADNEGRRIECMDGGWRLLNHAKYRAIRDEEAIKESKRKHINTRRAIERVEGVENVELCRTPSNAVELCRPQSNAVDRCRANAEAEAYTEAEASNPFPTSAPADDGGAGSEELDLGPTDDAPAVSTLAAPQITPVAAERPPAPPPADPRHHEITSAWGPAFREAFGVDYQFSGRDAKTLKRWLATSRATADETLATARAAWDRAKLDRFARCCREAATIHGLCTYYNDVGVELKSPLQPPAGGPGTGRRMTFAG